MVADYLSCLADIYCEGCLVSVSVAPAGPRRRINLYRILIDSQ